MSNTEGQFIAGIRALDARAARIIRMAPNAESAEDVLVNEPVISHERLRERDFHERTVIVAKLPRTLLGRGPQR